MDDVNPSDESNSTKSPGDGIRLDPLKSALAEISGVLRSVDLESPIGNIDFVMELTAFMHNESGEVDLEKTAGMVAGLLLVLADIVRRDIDPVGFACRIADEVDDFICDIPDWTGMPLIRVDIKDDSDCETNEVRSMTMNLEDFLERRVLPPDDLAALIRDLGLLDSGEDLVEILKRFDESGD